MAKSFSKLFVSVKISSYRNQNSHRNRDSKKMDAPICCMVKPAFSDTIRSSSEEEKKAKWRGILSNSAGYFR